MRIHALLLAAALAATLPAAHAGSREAVILYDWARHPAKTSEPPTGVMRIAERLDVTFDSRRDGEWKTVGDVQSWAFTMRVPGASSVAADFAFDAVPGAVLAVAGEHLIRSEARYISAHSGAETITFELTAPADGGQPSVRINSLRLSDPEVVAKNDGVDDEYVPYACHADTQRDKSARATAAICIDGQSCCTGVLINNAAGEGGAPKRYLLTAEHCQTGGAGASLTEPVLPESAIRVLWAFSDPCGASPRTWSPGSIPPGGNEQVGGRHVAEWKDLGEGTTSRGDLWLIELSQWPPAEADAWLSGFDARDGAQPGATCISDPAPCPDHYYVDGAPSADGAVYGIHHGGIRGRQYVESPDHDFVHQSTRVDPEASIASVQIKPESDGAIGRTSPGASGSGLFTLEHLYFAVASNGSSYWGMGGTWSKWGLGEFLAPGRDQEVARVMGGKVAPQPLPAPEIALITPSQSISLGESVTISWTVSNADSCVASGDWVGARPLTGSETLTPTIAGQARYALTCENAEQSATSQTVIGVSEGSAGGGGGGGSANLGSLCLLAMLGALRRRIR